MTRRLKYALTYSEGSVVPTDYIYATTERAVGVEDYSHGNGIKSYPKETKNLYRKRWAT